MILRTQEDFRSYEARNGFLITFTFAKSRRRERR